MCRISIKSVAKDDALKMAKRQAIEAGKDLGYYPMTLNKVAGAKSEAQIAIIMATARNHEIGS